MKIAGLVFAAAIGFMLLIGCTKEVTQTPAQSFAARSPAARATTQPRGTRVSAFNAPAQPAATPPLFAPLPRATFTPFVAPRAARPTTRARGQSLQTAVASATAMARSQQLGQPYQPGQQPYYPPGEQPYEPGQQPYYPTEQSPYQPGPQEQYGQPGLTGPYSPPGMMPYGPGAWIGGLTYVVHTGDTMYNIARRFGVTVEDLAAANGIPDLWRVEVGRVLFIPAAASPAPSPVTTYIVRPGDTLYNIARRFGLPLEVLASANGIPDPQRIFVGQRLVIPCVPPCPEPIVQPMPGYATPYSPGYTNPYPVETPYPPGYTNPYPIETPYPPDYPIDTPTPITPAPSSSTYLYSSVDGKFSVQYPTTWQNGTDNPSGYVVFWSQESTDPFSAGIAIVSRNNPTWRPSQQVLDDYKAALPGLMSGHLGGASFAWDNSTTPVTLGGNLAIADYGYAQVSGTNRDRLWAQAVNVGSQDYLALAWAPPDLWSSYQSQLTSLIDTVSFLP